MHLPKKINNVFCARKGNPSPTLFFFFLHASLCFPYFSLISLSLSLSLSLLQLFLSSSPLFYSSLSTFLSFFSFLFHSLYIFFHLFSIPLSPSLFVFCANFLRVFIIWLIVSSFFLRRLHLNSRVFSILHDYYYYHYLIFSFISYNPPPGLCQRPRVREGFDYMTSLYLCFYSILFICFCLILCIYVFCLILCIYVFCGILCIYVFCLILYIYVFCLILYIYVFCSILCIYVFLSLLILLSHWQNSP